MEMLMRISRGPTLRLLSMILFIVAISLSTTSCLPGSQTGTAPPTTSTPADDVLINIFRSIEEKRTDQFIAGVSQNANPDRDELWTKANDFFKAADQIEYNITVNTREKRGLEVVYIFTFERKYLSRVTGDVITRTGGTEWTISRASGRFLLEQIAGEDVFAFNAAD